MSVEDAVLSMIDGKLYATARAYVVDDPEQLPRELASEMDKTTMNPSFLWVAGRYVEANQRNKNGHYWTFDDLQKGEKSIKYTPLNTNHEWTKPIGTLVETKIVTRAQANDRVLPEIQALGVVWAANFPELATRVRAAHSEGSLWYSMECVAEAKQCLQCEEIFPWAAASHEVCQHLAESRIAPRRFINPIFLGGALIFPPENPAWPDADITEVARHLTEDYAHRGDHIMSVDEWNRLMSAVQSGT